MLGLSGGGVVAAYILCVLGAVLCVVYGVLNWNKGDEASPKDSGPEGRV